MGDDRIRSQRLQRYEAKYVITEAQAAQIRRYCVDYLPPDSHSAGQPGNEYPVVSMYLDSPSQVLLQQTLAKQMNRFKLRIRTYRKCTVPSTGLPAFFEIKRKANGVVHKTRAQVEPTVAESLLWNEDAPFDGSTERGAAARMRVNEFQGLRRRLGAVPVVGTFYMREAYEGVSAERTRITLDRNLHYGIPAPPGSRQREIWWQVDHGGVILEVKFDNTYPFWVGDMLRHVEVLRRGVCKYVICCRAAGIPLAREVDQGTL
ncbi:MAG: polyphosphate polymerase domain-containing protein [Phycisphaerales bacterium]|nr:MAG: polyphosphate polymerase domain-containing protein [Phycisphaerales bacterium]